MNWRDIITNLRIMPPDISQGGEINRVMDGRTPQCKETTVGIGILILQVETNLTITWSLTGWSTSLSGPLEYVHHCERLHVVVRHVVAYIVIILWVKIGVFVCWSVRETNPPRSNTCCACTVKSKIIPWTASCQFINGQKSSPPWWQKLAEEYKICTLHVTCHSQVKHM